MHSKNSYRIFKDLRWTTAMVCLVGGILPSMPLYAQPPPVWASAASFGGSGLDVGQAVKVDREGNRYVTGAFSATASFPVQATGTSRPTSTAHKTLKSDGGTDVFLAKYDPSGRLDWLLQIGGPEDDEGFDIAFDAERNIYLTGFFIDSATFRGVGGNETVTGSGQTMFLAKYTPTGSLHWVRTGTNDGGGDNRGLSVAIEPVRGSVYVTGISQGDTTFSSTNRSMHSVSGPGTWHMVLAKFDTSGSFKWGESNQASPNTVPYRVAVDADDNAYVTGWMEAEATFHSHDGHDVTVEGFSAPVQSIPDFPGDAFLVKYDGSGNVKWVNHVGGYKAIGNGVATSRDGRVTITGLIGNVADSSSQASTIVSSQPGGNNINLGGGVLTSPFNLDVFFATYDDAGVLLDARRFGGAKNESGNVVAYDHHNNLVVTGIFQNSIKIDSHTLTGKDPFNLFVAKFSHEEGRCVVSGDLTEEHQGAIWAMEADGPGVNGYEDVIGMDLTPEADVVVTDAYGPTAQFGGLKLTSAGSEDGSVALLHVPEEDEHR
jgi:Beta-propeller repeat